MSVIGGKDLSKIERNVEDCFATEQFVSIVITDSETEGSKSR